MAEKLLLYYKYVSEVSGVAGKMKLAQETKIPSTQASIEADSTQNIATFKKAIEKITGKAAPNL
ncbi:MAG: hypothetical protein ACYC4E_00085 [Carboxydocellales bacterium]